MANYRGRSSSSLGRMDSVLALWPLPLGFFAGLVGGGVIARWLALFLAAIGKALPKESPPVRRRAIVPVLLSTVLHPVPWLLFALLPYGLFRLFATPPRREWLWFLGGVALYFPFIGVTLLYAFRKARKIRAERASQT